MRVKISILTFALICWCGSVAAQGPSPQRTPEDFARAIQDAPCADGQDRDQEGLCPAAAETTRGFNLGAHAPRGSHAARPAQTAAASTLGDLRIMFHSGSSEMTAQGEAEAKSFAQALALPALARRRFEIAGHTDASGSPTRNLALSQARAEAVVDYLAANGVDRARLEAKGYGSDGLARPDAPNNAANRRVEARSIN